MILDAVYGMILIIIPGCWSLEDVSEKAQEFYCFKIGDKIICYAQIYYITRQFLTIQAPSAGNWSKNKKGENILQEILMGNTKVTYSFLST